MRDERPNLAAIAAAWLLSVGFDLLLHGGLLAHLYATPSPFLLEPLDAFKRIPIGYAAFLALTVALSWLLRGFQIHGAMAGARYGVVAGAVVWGALLLGLYSISTAPVSLLTAWWIGQTLELGLAGAVLGASLGGTPIRRLWRVVALSVFACIVATIALQSFGLAPATRIPT